MSFLHSLNASTILGDLSHSNGFQSDRVALHDGPSEKIALTCSKPPSPHRSTCVRDTATEEKVLRFHIWAEDA